ASRAERRSKTTRARRAARARPARKAVMAERFTASVGNGRAVRWGCQWRGRVKILFDSNVDMEGAGDGAVGGDDEVAAAAAGEHGAGKFVLIGAEEGREIDFDEGMADSLRQEGFPAGHGFVEGGAEGADIATADGVKAVMAGLAESGDPGGVEFFFAKRTVAFGARLDGQEMEDGFEPGGDGRIEERFDVGRKDAALDGEGVIEEVEAGIDEADHVLGAAGVGFVFV